MIQVRIADYSNAKDAKHIVDLLDHYAQDPMGGAAPLPKSVKQNLVSSLHKRPFALSLLAFVDGNAAGLVNAFEGFSTFACKPLINIHDLVVHKSFRGQGLSQQLLTGVEREARKRDCIKVTLEVLSNNRIACNSYRKFGFEPYELDPNAGPAQFWQKKL